MTQRSEYGVVRDDIPPSPTAITDGRQNNRRWPALWIMEVGDSVLYPLQDEAAIRAAIRKHKHRHGRLFAWERTSKGIRIWRTQ